MIFFVHKFGDLIVVKVESRSVVGFVNGKELIFVQDKFLVRELGRGDYGGVVIAWTLRIDKLLTLLTQPSAFSVLCDKQIHL